jgi:hypothetical protein
VAGESALVAQLAIVIPVYNESAARPVSPLSIDAAWNTEIGSSAKAQSSQRWCGARRSANQTPTSQAASPNKRAS